ncbi:MAG: glutamine amidotransferase family protein [Candidatus Coatesbacteria bacterium]
MHRPSPVPDLDFKVPSGCGLTGLISQKGELLPGDAIYRSLCSMEERGNGLGAGYAAYGIYPDFAANRAFHLMCDTEDARRAAEAVLRRDCTIRHDEPIPTSPVKALKNIPVLWRYFLDIKPEAVERVGGGATEPDAVVRLVMEINRKVDGAFVFSSGRNMGIFKGVGNPEEIGEFFRIPAYRANVWIGHNRFPTNSVSWWGGAHPFGLLDWSLVHNGEISSYGTNRRYLESYGYWCTLQTDTEVMAYLFDLLVRRHGLDFDLAAQVMAAPFWTRIEREEDPEARRLSSALRAVYGGALVSGPFAVLVSDGKSLVGLNDRIKLRPLVAARKGSVSYIASEEAAIRCICPDPEALWMPDAGVPTVVTVEA